MQIVWRVRRDTGNEEDRKSETMMKKTIFGNKDRVGRKMEARTTKISLGVKTLGSTRLRRLLQYDDIRRIRWFIITIEWLFREFYMEKKNETKLPRTENRRYLPSRQSCPIGSLGFTTK